LNEPAAGCTSANAEKRWEGSLMNKPNQLLAEHSGIGYVGVCKCGSLNVSIGMTTLHLKPEAFLKVSALMRNAVEEYIQQKQLSETTTDSLSVVSHSCSSLVN